MTALSRVRTVEAPLEPHRWAWPEANRDAVAAHWQALKCRRPPIFDGRVLMAREPRVGGGRCLVPFFEAGYADMLGWIAAGFPPEPDGSAVLNAFAMGALRGTDGAFLLGRMGEGTANAGRLYFPCGTPDLSDVAGGVVDLLGSLRREIAEETGLGPADYALADEWTLVRSGGLLALIRVAQLATPAAEARERALAFIAADPAPELADIVVARGPEAIEPSMPGIMPIFLRDAFAADQR